MKRLAHLIILMAILLFAVPTIAQSPVWPGQSGNPVGFAAAPGWPGSFTATACPSSPASGTSWSNATVISNCTYTSNGSASITLSCNYCEFWYVDFNSGVLVTGQNPVNQMNGNHMLFVGDRFQSNNIQGGNVSVGNGTGNGLYQYYFYDSFVPLVSLSPSPLGGTWPGSGAGLNTIVQTKNVTSIPNENGYGYGLNISQNSGPLYVDHCDFWGFANAISWYATAGVQVITGNWMHEPRYAQPLSGGGDHTDGPGYLNGGPAPNNVTLVDNTIAVNGTTDDIAWQGATSGYQNFYTNENYISGDGADTVIMPGGGGTNTMTNSSFYGNVFGTDLMSGGPTYGPQFTMGASNTWTCNTIAFAAGTTWQDPNDNWKPTSGMNGQYFIIPTGSAPNLSYNGATDASFGQSLNSVCGVPSPASLNFGTQGTGSSSAGTAVTLKNTNTGTLSSISVGLATGSQFSISSNTCGSTLASSASCTITVNFSPTALGPQTDTLQITDNTTGVTSPQLVPLSGLGTSGNVSISPTSLAFGTVTQNTASSSQTVTLTNNTGVTITLTGTTFTGTNGSDFAAPVTNTCTSGTVTDGSTCQVKVVFTPTASPTTAETGTLNIPFTGAGGSPLTVSLTGTSGATSNPPAPSPKSFTWNGTVQKHPNISVTCPCTLSVSDILSCVCTATLK